MESTAPGMPICKSSKMRHALQLTERVAGTLASVLITGESGVGKERIARLLHDGSTHSKGSFVPINCGAIPESLLESELFGHMKGAFTGADRDRIGLFEAGDGGTLFLDEIGEMPEIMQVKLLRAIQEREFRPIGARESRRVDVRIVAATNRDLATRCEDGHFRKDLYYRVRVVEIHVPSLRERSEDILDLAMELLTELRLTHSAGPNQISNQAQALLTAYSWPGNVRELRNALEHGRALSRTDSIEAVDLPVEISFRLPSALGQKSLPPLAEIEKEAILAALRDQDGNQKRTAGMLGIGTATLYRKLRSYGMTKSRQNL